jgi:signal transduction histidine kinase
VDGWLVAFQILQLLVFVVAALAALRVWRQQRSRPAVWLVAAFTTLGVSLLVSRLFPADGAGADVPWVRDLVVIGIGTFPWLLALFAWSFEGRLPRWLVASGGVVAALGVWSLLLSPLAVDATSRTSVERAFLMTFILVWTALSCATAVRLWLAGGTQPLVRARMRLMSIGSLVLAAALLLAGAAPPDAAAWTPLVTTGLSIMAVVSFTAGFAPPRPLRVWWRYRLTPEWQQMQRDLIAASTAEEAAQAVVPVVAGLSGGGAAVVGADGDLLAYAELDADDARATALAIASDEPLAPGTEVVDVDGASMVIRPTPYTPLFGRDERDLVAGLAVELRLALHRGQLFSAQGRARDELQRARDEEQAMIMGLAHDLRGSSSTLGGYTSLLRTSGDEQEQEEILGGIEASAAHLEELVGSLLELGRIGLARPRVDPVDLDQVVGEMIARLEPLYPRIRFVRAALPTIPGDRLELVQVFENLFVNAAKHGGAEDLTITITSEQDDDVVTIDVCDDGQGIPATDRHAVFRLFHRGRSAGGLGSGVGLNLVRRIVEAHDGTIELLDNRPGAHFRLCFPLVAEERPRSDEPPADVSDSAPDAIPETAVGPSPGVAPLITSETSNRPV